MTVGEKLHQTLLQLESAQASLKTFALDTGDTQAKAMYTQIADKLAREIIEPLRNRVNVEGQEPQYRVFQQATQKAQQAGQQGQAPLGQFQQGPPAKQGQPGQQGPRFS